MRSLGCLLGLLAVAGSILFYCESDRWSHPPAGALVPDEPVQTRTEDKVFTLGMCRVSTLANYRIRARVISAKTYWFDHESDISPEDLALGWGPMSDWAVYGKLNIGQQGRYYHYSWGREGPPIAPGIIRTHSANTHIIPANDAVRKTLRTVRAGEIVRMAGELVEVRDAQGSVWRSSLTRDDTGNGACELLYAESLAIDPP